MSCHNVLQGPAQGRTTTDGPIMLSALTAFMVRAGLVRPSPDHPQPRPRSQSRSRSPAMRLLGDPLAGPRPSATPPTHFTGPSRNNPQADGLSAPLRDSLAGHQASTTPPSSSDYPLKPQPTMMHTSTPSHHDIAGDQPSAAPCEQPHHPFEFTPSTRYRRPQPVNPVSSLTSALSCRAPDKPPPPFREVLQAAYQTQSAVDPVSRKGPHFCKHHLGWFE